MNNQLIESIKKCTVDGNIVRLPQYEMLTNYKDVRKALINAGGTYKRNTFVFTSNAQPFIDRLCGGESVNIKKEFQFFETPGDLADKLVNMAEISESHSWNSKFKVLEPSAGQGAIIDAIHRTAYGMPIYAIELMKENRTILKEKYKTQKDLDYFFLGAEKDFMSFETDMKFERIIANPPFTKNQDIDHVRKMYSHLDEKGILVSVMSKSWTFGSQKKQVEFREWLKKVGAETTEIEPGTFFSSGTQVGGMIVRIKK